MEQARKGFLVGRAGGRFEEYIEVKDFVFHLAGRLYLVGRRPKPSKQETETQRMRWVNPDRAGLRAGWERVRGWLYNALKAIASSSGPGRLAEFGPAP